MDRRNPPDLASQFGSGDSSTSPNVPQQIHVHNHQAGGGWWVRLLVAVLVFSLLLNLGQLASFRDYQSGTSAPYEKFVEGKLSSSDKIALLEVDGVIMPPQSTRILKAIERIEKDDKIRGVVVVIDSPGGLVADSHRIYRALSKLRDKKPMVVSMGRMAASGGYYVAMGGGPEAKIFAEEITWTGSIGVIIPRYNLSELGDKIGMKSEALKTGPLKDALDPFRPLGEEERRVWDTILQEALDQFVQVIEDGRPQLDEGAIRRLATGQVFTAQQAVQLKLVDEIGDRDAAVEALKAKLNLTDARIIRFEQPPTLAETLLGVQARASGEALDPLSRLLEGGVPRAMYLFGWQPGLAAP